MSAFNRPFAEPDVKQALRMTLPPRQRAEFDRLQADAARGPKGLARLNWQPPQKKLVVDQTPQELAERLTTIEAAVDRLDAESLETLHIEQGSADAVVEKLLDNGMVRERLADGSGFIERPVVSEAA